MTKMTYVTALDNALEVLNTAMATDPDMFPNMAETIEKLTALKAQTEKRNTADRKPTKAQIANESLKAQVVAVMTKEPATVTELMARSADLSALSNQKVSALVNALVREGVALKVPDGRKSTFCLA